MIKIPRKTCYTRKPFQSYQNSRNLGYQNKRIKRFRNCLPYWSTNFRDRKYFFQLNLVFIADSHMVSVFYSWIWYLSPTVFVPDFFENTILRLEAVNGTVLQEKCVPEFLILLNFASFTGKHLCWSHVLIEPSGLQLYLKVPPTQVASCKICEIFKKIYFEENLWTTASETSSNFTWTAPFW